MNPQIEQLKRKLCHLTDRPLLEADPRQPPPAGSLVEWCGPAGSGAASANLPVVRQILASRPGLWAAVDPTGEFHPLAAWGWGIPLERLVVISPQSPMDHDWAVEHSLRSSAVAVTWCWIEPHHHQLRRWKRAVEIGGGLGVLFRTNEARNTGTGVDLRWCASLEEAGLEDRSLKARVDYCRGNLLQGRTFDLQVHDAEGDLSVVPELARSADPLRASGA